MKTCAVLLCLCLTACSMSVGVGYRKSPTVDPPVVGVTPAQIEALIAILGQDWSKIAEYALPKGEEVTLGGWCDVEIQ